MIKLLVVDDSALMRRLLVGLFNTEPDFEIRVARNGKEAVTENREFQPDVVTLDINMPEMDGLTALSLLMAERPVPVVMVSSLTNEGALATFEALNLGAVDYVCKPQGTISLSVEAVQADLVRKVRAAAKARLRSPDRQSKAIGLAQRLRADRAQLLAKSQEEKNIRRRHGKHQKGLVIMGVSTGGPSTLEEILPLLPADFPWPIVVAQHMPGSFTRPFAERMNKLCALEVHEIQAPTPLLPGNVYIAKGGADVVLTERVGQLVAVTKPENPAHLWHPSVELLGLSALEHCNPAHVVAVMLTGMGYDGAKAFTELKQKGARTIAESEESAIVFGMPAELIALGGASVVLPANKIAHQLLAWADA